MFKKIFQLKFYFLFIIFVLVLGSSFISIQTLAEAAHEEIDLEIFGINFGKADLSGLSLPLITVLVAIVDGFNPCAMWVLLFLISLLLEEKNVLKRWLLGGIFLLVSGFSYYLFLTAWLNINELIGFIAWTRAIIALIAVGIGLWSIRSYFLEKDESGCKVGEKVEKQKTFKKLQGIVSQKNIWISILGIVILAFSVNLFELLCSAALPAIYTNLLATQEVVGLSKHAYLLLYVLIFMLDDLLIFAIAMFTLQATGISTKYNRLVQLISGIIMLLFGFWITYEVAVGIRLL